MSVEHKKGNICAINPLYIANLSTKYLMTQEEEACVT